MKKWQPYNHKLFSWRIYAHVPLDISAGFSCCEEAPDGRLNSEAAGAASGLPPASSPLPAMITRPRPGAGDADALTRTVAPLLQLVLAVLSSRLSLLQGHAPCSTDTHKRKTRVEPALCFPLAFARSLFLQRRARLRWSPRASWWPTLAAAAPDGTASAGSPGGCSAHRWKRAKSGFWTLKWSPSCRT